MKNRENTTSTACIPRKRCFSRNSPARVARDLHIPQSWIWWWIYSGKLPHKLINGNVQIDIGAVHLLMAGPEASIEAYEVTGEPITCALRASYLKVIWKEAPGGLFSVEPKEKSA